MLTVFRERLLAGLALNAVSALALQGSVLLSSVIVARLVGLQGFGAFSVLVTTVMTVAGVAQGASGLVATKYVAEFLPVSRDQVAGVLRLCRLATACSGLAAAVLVALGAGFIASDLLGKPELIEQVRWVAVAIFFQVAVTSVYGALQGFGAFREIGLAGVVAGVIHLGCTVLGAMYLGLTGAIAGFVLASVGRAVVFSLALRQVVRARDLPRRARLDPATARRVWAFAIPASIASLVTLPCLWGVTAVVARQPEGLAWVALFTVGHQLRLVVMQLPQLLNAVSFSVLSRLKGQGEVAGFRKVFWSNLVLTVSIALVVVAALVLALDQILVLYGPAFVAGQPVVVVLLGAVVPEMVALSAYQLVQTSGRMWRSLWLIVVPRDGGYLLLAAVLIPAVGLVGAAWAYFIAQVIGLAATWMVGRGGWSR